MDYIVFYQYRSAPSAYVIIKGGIIQVANQVGSLTLLPPIDQLSPLPPFVPSAQSRDIRANPIKHEDVACHSPGTLRSAVGPMQR